MADLFEKFIADQRKKTDLVYQTLFSAAGMGHDSPGNAPPSLQDQLNSIPKPGPGPKQAPPKQAPTPKSSGGGGGRGPGNSSGGNVPPSLSDQLDATPKPSRDWTGIQNRIAAKQAPPPRTWEPVDRPSLRESRAFDVPAPVPVANIAMPLGLTSRPQPLAGIGGIDTIGGGGGRGPMQEPFFAPALPDDPETLEIWDVPGQGQIIVPAGSFTAPGGATKTADLTDPAQIEAAKQSPMWWETADPSNEYFTPVSVEPTGPSNARGAVSEASFWNAVQRGDTAKQYEEPKDTAGFNETVSGIRRPTPEQRARSFETQTGFAPPSTTGDATRQDDASLGDWQGPQFPVTESTDLDTLPNARPGYIWIMPGDSDIPVEIPEDQPLPAGSYLIKGDGENVSEPKEPLFTIDGITDAVVDAVLDSPVGDLIPEAAVSLGSLWEDVKGEASVLNEFAPLWIETTKRGIQESGLPEMLDNAVNLLPAPIRGPLEEVVPRLIEWSGWAQNEVGSFIFDNYSDIVERGKLKLGPFEIDLPDAATFPIQVIDDVTRLVSPSGESLSDAYRRGGQGAALDWIRSDVFGNTLVGYMWVLGFQVITDPLTYAPFVGAALRGVRGTGVLARGARGIGRGVNIAEGASDLGLGYVAEGIFRGVPRLPGVHRAFAPTDETARGISGTAGREAFSELEGAPVSGVPTRPVTVDPVTPAAPDPSTVTPVAPDPVTVTPITPDPTPPRFTPEAAANTPVRGITDEDPQIVGLNGRRIEPGDLNRDGSPAAIRTDKGPLDVSNVPKRFHPYLRNLVQANDVPSVQALVDDLRTDGSFFRQVDTTAGPKGNATPANALDTSEFTADFYDQYRAINPDAILPRFAPSQAAALGANYRLMEQAIHQPWAETGPARQTLTDQGYLLDTVPEGTLTRSQQDALNNYIRLIDQYLYWHPTSLSDVNFAQAAARRDAIARYFTDRGLAYGDNVRKGGGGRTAPSNAGNDPRTAGSPARTPGGTPAARTGRGVTTSQAAPAAIIHPYGDVAGYPIMPGTASGPNAPTIVRIDADTNVALTPVPVDTVPQPARERFPDAAETEWTEAVIQDPALPDPPRHYAPTREQALDLAVQDAQGRGLVGDFFERPANRQTSEALDVESTAKQNIAKVRGLPSVGKTRSNLPNGVRIAHAGTIDLGGTTAPVWTVTTPDGTATIVKEGTSYRVAPDAVVDESILADMDRVPSFETPQDALVEAQMQARFGTATEPTGATAAPAATPPVPETVRDFAIREGVVDASAADALDTYGRTRAWTDERRDAIYGMMNRITRKQGQPVIDAGDLATANGRQQLAKLEDLARLQDANAGLARGLEGTTGKKRQQLQARIDKNRIRIRQLEDGLRMNNRAAIARPGDFDGSALSEIGRSTPRQKALSKAVRSIKNLVVQDVPVASMPMPSGIRQYDGMTYLEGVPISDKALVDLTKYLFDNGDTVIDRISRKINDLRANPTLWDGTNPGEILDRAFRETRAEYETLLDQLFPVKAKRTGPLRSFGIATGLFRDSILANWLTGWTRYLGTQYLGNIHLSFLSGADNGLALAKRTLTSQPAVRGAVAEMYDVTGANPVRVAEDMTATERFDMAAGQPPSSAVFDRNTGEFGQRRTELGNWYASHNMKMPAPLKAVLGDERIYREGLIADTINRDNIYQNVTRRQLADDQRTFDAQARRRLADAGLDEAAVNQAMRDFYATVDMQWGWKASQVRTYFSTHLDEAISDRLARDWQNAINTRRKIANDEVKRITFGGTGRTRLDDFVSNFILFSYFQSRQVKFLTTQALKHPAILNFYVNSQDALNDYADTHPDMPSWLRGSVKAADLLGVSVYLDPTALLQVGSIYGNVQDSLFEDPDQTWLTEKLGTNIPFLGGTVEDWFFINPVIAQPLNLFGFLSDDRNVDFLNTNQWGRAGALVINIGANKGWWGEPGELIGNPIANFWNQGRDWASGIGLPGSVEVEYVDSVNNEERKLNALIVDIAEEQGLNPANPDDYAIIEAAKNDPNHPLYKEAWSRYVLGETVAIGVKSTPIIASFRPQVRLQNSEGRDLILNQNGRDAIALRNTTDAEVGEFKAGAKGYYALGDPFDPLVDSLYTDLVYGEITDPVTLDGKTYSAKEINSWDTETRKDFARAFLVDNDLYEGWQEYQNEQAEYLALPENAAFAQYKTWSGDIRDYPGGIEQYWKDVAEGNPNAKRWYEQLDPDLSPEDREKALTSQRAFMAVKGNQMDYNDPTPIDTNDFDPVNIANGPAKPIENEPYVSEFDQSFMQDLNTFTEYAVEAEPIMQGILTEYGYDPNTPLNSIPYRTRSDIADTYFDRTGYPYPEPKGAVLDYFQWVSKQAPGSDTSPEAYLEWSNDQYVAKMPSAFNEDIETEDAIESGEFDPIDFVNRSRTLDPGYRWEDQPWYSQP